MAGQWLRLIAACEGLMERGRLDDSLVCELGCGRGHDRQAGWPALGSFGHAHQVRFRGLDALRAGVLGGSLHALFDDGALLIPHREAALQLLSHDGIMGLETRRQTRQTDILYGGR
jgi:hypothetical protein